MSAAERLERIENCLRLIDELGQQEREARAARLEVEDALAGLLRNGC